MIAYKFPQASLRQAAPPAVIRSMPDPVPPPEPTFTGLPGLIESVFVLSILSAGAWAGIHTGINGKEIPLKAAGWVGGAGAALLGLLYLGTKLDLTQSVGFPALRVTPT